MSVALTAAWEIGGLLLLGVTQAAAGAGIATHTCKNGLTVVVAENHSIPLVTLEIAAKNGSMTEPPELNGVSHLYEHMFFKANAKLPDQQAWMARARDLGLVWNGSTDTERVNYFLTTTSDHLDATLAFMHDAIVSPRFDQKELERERVVVTGEIDRNESNPFYHFAHTLDQHVWWKYPSRKDPLGRRATVLAATVAQLRTIQARYYVPNNSVLVVTGDVAADAIFAAADTSFADWRSAPDPFQKYPLVTHPPLPRSEVVVVEQPVQTLTGAFVWHGPSTVGPEQADTYPADALSAALGEPSSAFHAALIDSGACVGAGISWSTQRNVGPITLSFEALPERTDTCLRAIQSQLPRLADPTYVSAEELHRGAHALEIALVHERERPTQLAHTLSFFETSAGLDYYLTYVDKLYEVRQADVARYVAKYISNRPYVFGVMVSPEMKAHGLDRAHFEALLGISHLGISNGARH